MKVSRNTNLDVIRGVAVVLVIMHHFVQNFSNSSEKFQFSFFQELGEFFLYYGHYGVEVFFIVSGYIMYTLYSEVDNFFYFLIKRITRLIPALWFIILINILVLYLQGQLKISDVLSSITSGFLLDPPIPNAIFGVEYFHWTYDSFWTLFVEIRFYIFFGITFYLLRKASLKSRVYSLTAIIVVAKILSLFLLSTGNQSLSTISHYLFFPEWSGFFLAGFWIGRASQAETRKLKIFSYLATSTLCLIWGFTSFYNQFQTRTTPVLAIVAMFILVRVILQFPQPLKDFIAQKIGAPSYVSYVIHEMIFREALFQDEISMKFMVLAMVVLLMTFIFAYQFHVKIEIGSIRKLRQIIFKFI